MSNRSIADQLVREYNLPVRQARYRRDGKWYHHLEHFPAAYLDEHGYVVFQTRAEYENCPDLQLQQDVHIGGDGISSMPGYRRFPRSAS